MPDKDETSFFTNIYGRLANYPFRIIYIIELFPQELLRRE